MDFAFLFPGQGSQSLNMMSGFNDFTIVKDTFNEASEILKIDLLGLLNSQDNETINQTVITQPLVLTSSISVLRIYKSLTDKIPIVLAGHSLGEYTSLVAADSLRFSDAVSLVSKRAKLMQEAVKEGQGLMAAILGLNEDQVISVCKMASKFGGVVEAVNFNSPEQIVIAGEKNAVQKAIEIAKEYGAKRALPLNVSVPSHCKLMEPASLKLKEILNDIDFQVPKINVINNADVKVNNSIDSIKDALVRQLYSPVRWTQTINKIYNYGILNVVECNPSRILSGLVKRINNKINCVSFFNIKDINDFINI